MTRIKLSASRQDIPAETRERIVGLLNQQLADTLDLFTQVKQAHWNVGGPNFIALHELFDDLAEEVEDFTDTIAERATALAGVALGTARMAAASSRLPEFPAEAIEGRACVEALATRFSALAKTTRAAIDTASELRDADTADVFTEVSRALDKNLWFLEAHLRG